VTYSRSSFYLSPVQSFGSTIAALHPFRRDPRSMDLIPPRVLQLLDGELFKLLFGDRGHSAPFRRFSRRQQLSGNSDSCIFLQLAVGVNLLGVKLAGGTSC
jgi:hypothetical protein